MRVTLVIFTHDYALMFIKHEISSLSTSCFFLQHHFPIVKQLQKGWFQLLLRSLLTDLGIKGVACVMQGFQKHHEEPVGS